jgi:hypothetical protein
MDVIVGPGDALLDRLADHSRRLAGGSARVLVAWATDEGAWRLLEAVEHRLALDVIVGVNEKGTTAEALTRLLSHGARVRIHYKHPSQTFHPKVYWFADDFHAPSATSITVGSANLTGGGLVSNIEVSTDVRMAAPFSEADESLWNQVSAWYAELADSPYTHDVLDEDAIESLFRRGYLSVEAQLQRRRRSSRRGERPVTSLPVGPPPRRPRRGYERTALPFDLPEDEPLPPYVPDDADPVKAGAPIADRFFVRTLTPNDVSKLHGQQVGTFEPDLGETARDRYPLFWGWPNDYTPAGLRTEYRAPARLLSSETPPGGVEITAVLWFRAARPGHAAEHRLSLQPIGDVRSATPPGFDTESLLVVERAPDDWDAAYVIRLLTPDDPGYADYDQYAATQNPQHRYGYGPD